MKKTIHLFFGIFFTSFIAKAQQAEVVGILPPATAKAEEYSEWIKQDAINKSGEKIGTYEYRIAFTKRKALACHFDLQIKNTSSEKLKFAVLAEYRDRLVKRQFSDAHSEKVKPGETVSIDILTQGNKANKENKEEDDFTRCMGCDLKYTIVVGN